MITLSPTPPQDSPVAHLKGIFPDFDEAVIISVLESVDNDQDRALDVLLGMNDPTYVPSAPSPAIQSQHPHQQQPDLTQEDLDAQLARRLASEEEEAARAWSSDRQPGWGGVPPSQQQHQQQASYQAYQPRRSSDRDSGSWTDWRTGQHRTSQPPGQGQRDTMAEFQEGFYKIAETGKRTFSTIVSKVKAKMQEFDQGSGLGLGNASTNAYSAHDPNLQSTPAQGYTHSSPYSAGRSTTSWSGGQPRSNTYASASPTFAPPIPPIDTRPNTRTRTPTPPVVRGYDLSDPAEGGVSPRAHTPPPPFPSEHITMGSSGAEGEPPLSALPTSPDHAPPGAFPLRSGSPTPFTASSQPRGSTSGPGAVPVSGLLPSSGPQGAEGTVPRSNVEFSKLGLLPKRPVSLVRPLSPPAAAAGGRSYAPAQRKESSYDELEYVENPFEDQH
ncbi:hypothetical protein BKA82DRAFT_21998 [Pisolithus tinctorius]|uniref:CUE domain-containing protein n=1 Tax=Pisolithus tinctorius Marx 270 TaxID=870435 RepID=A0A0C3PL95_PISTI|nr:hypothetical protein BKA82DRAFT_21998 [Pisolithus tinctorius]KIO09486.1 hypothetical protein M404DRAFT_21998 [Pisolithus tinctorius Marx 270]